MPRQYGAVLKSKETTRQKTKHRKVHDALNTDGQKNNLIRLKVSRDMLTKDYIAGLVISIVTVLGALAAGWLSVEM